MAIEGMETSPEPRGNAPPTTPWLFVDVDRVEMREEILAWESATERKILWYQQLLAMVRQTCNLPPKN